MDYKEKYNKLVEAVKVLQETNPSDEGIQNWVNDNVPELAESQDEKVREWVYNYFRSCFPTWIHPDITCGEILSWLEKQGTSYTKRDVDNAYVEGMAFAKDELEKQKPAWSEEDDMMLECVLDKIGDLGTGVMCKEWLKSLKQRYTWKPTSAQMKALDSAIDEFDGCQEYDSLVSLKKDLEKLKGE